MHTTPLSRRPASRGTLLLAWCLVLVPLLWSTTGDARAQASDGTAVPADPREGLQPGWNDAGEAVRNMKLIAHEGRPEALINPQDRGDFGTANTDIAFSGTYAFVGNYSGVQVWDVSNPSDPVLRTTVVCPGGQGDVSVYGNLLFMSVEETRGRIDCGSEGVAEPVSDERFRGVRIFDISDIEAPQQVAVVQTCRGSHTHTLVPDPNDTENVYVYVSGTSRVRPGDELAGCSTGDPEENPNTSRFRIEVIKVPLAAPQEARVVNEPRIFADPQTGNIGGLWRGGQHGEGTQATAETDQCHDITVYPELGLAAGACSGNGILLDISDPANPKRIAEVSDPNFAYWHSATFSNEGDKVLYTDEWGGGTAPRCRATDPAEWGANAIFTLTDGRLEHAGYFKLPAAQTAQENCVAHNGSLIPVPGRDIMAQAWYQGGVSVIDFTDPENPIEIAFFDRGPLDPEQMIIGGYWSTYWYNGHIYGTEIMRGLDIFELTPSEYLSHNEIEAARQVTLDRFNPQVQTKLVWPASFAVARAYLDQLVRGEGIASVRAARIAADIDRAERVADDDRAAAASQLEATAGQVEAVLQAVTAGDESGDLRRLQLLASSLRDLSASLR